MASVGLGGSRCLLGAPLTEEQGAEESSSTSGQRYESRPPPVVVKRAVDNVEDDGERQQVGQVAKAAILFVLLGCELGRGSCASRGKFFAFDSLLSCLVQVLHGFVNLALMLGHVFLYACSLLEGRHVAEEVVIHVAIVGEATDENRSANRDISCVAVGRECHSEMSRSK